MCEKGHVAEIDLLVGILTNTLNCCARQRNCVYYLIWTKCWYELNFLYSYNTFLKWFSLLNSLYIKNGVKIWKNFKNFSILIPFFVHIFDCRITASVEIVCKIERLSSFSFILCPFAMCLVSLNICDLSCCRLTVF